MDYWEYEIRRLVNTASVSVGIGKIQLCHNLVWEKSGTTFVLQIFIFELVQYTFCQYFLSACKYKDILHDYFPLKLIGKYLLNSVFLK
jgi:hypothetical protein